MYTFIAYLIGKIKYKQLRLEVFEDRETASDVYLKMLHTYVKEGMNKEYVSLLLDSNNQIITSWALETPFDLYNIAVAAITKFKNGGKLEPFPGMTVENLLGTVIYRELKEIKEKSETENHESLSL